MSEKIQENTAEEQVKKEKKSIGAALKNVTSKFSALFNKKSGDEDGGTDKKTAEEEEPKPRKPFPFKEILIVVGLSAALSMAILFLMDLGGVRTSMRSGITDFLLGMEKQVITQRLEAEYAAKMEEEMSNMLVVERQNLIAEYETLNSEKAALDKREKDIEKNEALISQRLDEVESEKATVLEQQALLEGKISEIKDLAKIYENMDPANAADIMASMENETLMLGILGNMKEDNVAEILELMETAKAADILSKMGQ